jgi:hypothetical protein
MPISPVIANTVEVRLLWALAGNGAINVLHATSPTVPVNQALANTLGAAIKSAFTANLGPMFNSGSGLIRVGVRDLRIEHAAEFLDAGTSVVGSGVGDSLPSQVALCITLRTASAGKSFRGRVYLGGFIETENDAAGTALTVVSTNCVSFLTAVSSAMTASGLTFAVASRPAERTTLVETTFHNDGTTSTRTVTQSPARAGGSTPVTSISSRNSQWETQRRRTNGRGAVPTSLTAVAESHI